MNHGQVTSGLFMFGFIFLWVAVIGLALVLFAEYIVPLLRSVSNIYLTMFVFMASL